MEIVSEIISNAMDLAGGGAVDFKLNSATLLAMNVIADMELELKFSAHGAQTARTDKTLSQREGNLAFTPSFIRCRTGNKWEIIEIVSDIEDLTAAENDNRRAIIFYGENPVTYQLSFTPTISLKAELWGRAEESEPDSIKAEMSFPKEFTHLAANRTAIMLLDELLLQPNAENLIAFARRRTESLLLRQRSLEHRWTVYRSNAANSHADAVVRPYDPFDEYGKVFEIDS